MNQELQKRVKNLLDYLENIVKLGLKVIRTVDDHDDFLLFQHELPDTDDIALFTRSNDDLSWLTIYRQIIPDPPELPDNLKNWIEVSTDPDKEPQVIEQRQIEGDDVSFYDDESRQDTYIEYLDIWEHWATETRPKKKVQSLFTKLFHAREQLKYDEQLELIWGHGILLWKYNEYTIKYPMITQRMLIEHYPSEGIIHVLPHDDAEPRLEFDALADLNLPDLSEVRMHFKETEYDTAVKGSYLDILKEIAGRLSTDGLLVSLSEIQTLGAPTNKLRVVDCWVLFVRKRQQDAIIRDIEAFRDQLKTNELALPGGLLSFLRDPDETPAKWDEHKSRDEWSALLDKQVLFPLPANQEQIQIIDRIERADGVVVWGPPGTGKSHTIANLICHFMADGKRVLVTTQKDQALVVLQEMIPDDLSPLCMSVLSNVRDSREKLERAVASITEIVTQSQPHALRREIEELESKIDQYHEELVTTQRKIEDLARAQLRQIVERDGEPVLPAELVKKMQKDEERHAWLRDILPYEVRLIVRDGKDVVQIIAEPSVPNEEIEELKNLRKRVIEYLDDFSYELPATTDLVDEVTFNKMVEDLQKISRLDEDINQYVHDLIFKDESDEALNQALAELKQGLETYKLIGEDWQRSLLITIRTRSLEAEQINKAAASLDNYVKNVEELYQKRDLLKSINLGNVATLENLKIFVTQVIVRLNAGKKPWGFFDFDRKKKQALKAIHVNAKPPTSKEDWEAALHYIDFLLSIKDLRFRWNSLARNIGAVEIDETEAVTEQEAKVLLPLVEKLNAPIIYETIYLPRIREALVRIIVGVENVLADNSLENVYKALSLKKEQEHFRSSKILLDRLRGNLQQIISRGRFHPVVREMLNCLNEIFSGFNAIVDRWGITYQKVKTLEDLRHDYNRFNELLNRLEKNAPNWVENWKRQDIQETDLCPPYWRESWQFQALKKYLQDISDATQKISELEDKQERLIKSLGYSKEKLVLAKTKLGLIRNTSDAHLQALERWRLAVKKLGKGTGKWAWKKEKVVQQEMSQAKNAVPVWIMPLYRVSETIPSEFESFDVVIVDEASQCDVRAFLALARGKKVIIVGDPQQISPDAVGIPEAEVQRLIREYLSEIPGGHHFDLKTGLYDIAKITFSGQGALMLREHFRCIPEIIQFSNELCYQGRIVPLRNPPPTQRLEPVLESVFVEGGYREGRQDINKPEARTICEKLKQMVEDTRYKGKTFGVISLTGYDQAKYIFNIIDEYLTPEQQDAFKFRVGDAYAFQGDERDVMLLSMVVGSNDEKRLTALISEVYRQRFNVAASRAKDKLILFHSVRLGTDLKNPEDLRYRLLNFIQNRIPFTREKEKLRDLCESDFEKAAYDWLTNCGYRVTPQVNVGTKRIDLVVEGINTRLAVECDGDKWHPPEKWWEDRIRQRQLERAGWTFFRVWGSAFYRDPDSAMSPILPMLEELQIWPGQSLSPLE